MERDALTFSSNVITPDKSITGCLCTLCFLPLPLNLQHNMIYYWVLSSMNLYIPYWFILVVFVPIERCAIQARASAASFNCTLWDWRLSMAELTLHPPAIVHSSYKKEQFSFFSTLTLAIWGKLISSLFPFGFHHRYKRTPPGSLEKNCNTVASVWWESGVLYVYPFWCSLPTRFSSGFKQV